MVHVRAVKILCLFLLVISLGKNALASPSLWRETLHSLVRLSRAGNIPEAQTLVRDTGWWLGGSASREDFVGLFKALDEEDFRKAGVPLLRRMQFWNEGTHCQGCRVENPGGQARNLAARTIKALGKPQDPGQYTFVPLGHCEDIEVAGHHTLGENVCAFTFGGSVLRSLKVVGNSVSCLRREGAPHLEELTWTGVQALVRLPNTVYPDKTLEDLAFSALVKQSFPALRKLTLGLDLGSDPFARHHLGKLLRRYTAGHPVWLDATVTLDGEMRVRKERDEFLEEVRRSVSRQTAVTKGEDDTHGVHVRIRFPDPYLLDEGEG
jgi:hypothetical protein